MGKEFGAWLKQARESKGLTREELGHYAGITGSTIGQIERGHINKPPFNRLQGFSRALGVKVGTIKHRLERSL